MSKALVRPIDILIVESNPHDTRLIHELLGQYRVLNRLSYAKDGNEALTHIYEFKPDLVLLDWDIPPPSGQEVLRKIRADPALDDVHVAVVMGSAAEADFIRRFDPPPNAMVEKPIDLERLASIISQIDHFHVSIVTVPEMEAKK